jgi:hypothetical protein
MDSEPLLEIVIQDQVNESKKENCIIKNCGGIIVIVNVCFIFLLIVAVILGILKITNKI